MTKLAAAAALSALLIGACSAGEPASSPNGASVQAGAAESGSAAGPGQPEMPANAANGSGEPVPPPDAVSHPNGYLPPAPGEPAPESANSSGAEESPPATEDEYMRNRQSGGR